MRDRHSFNPFDLLKRYVRNWLLPYPFKIVGYFMFLAMLVVLAADILLNVEVVAGDIVAPDLFPSVVHRVQIILLHLAMFLVACSRERNEDEMIASLRGETLKEVCYIAFFVWVAYSVIMACVSKELFYIVHDEPFVTPFVVWVLYFARFEGKLKRLRQESRRFTL
ncbi:MAG: hypothetical protein II274_02140 [Alistipes sp.]|nr:hypothetical protein [Alistipes sp.]